MVFVPAHNQAVVGEEMDQSVKYKGKIHHLEREEVLALLPGVVDQLYKWHVDLVSGICAFLNISKIDHLIDPSAIELRDSPGCEETSELESDNDDDEK